MSLFIKVIYVNDGSIDAVTGWELDRDAVALPAPGAGYVWFAVADDNTFSGMGFELFVNNFQNYEIDGTSQVVAQGGAPVATDRRTVVTEDTSIKEALLRANQTTIFNNL